MRIPTESSYAGSADNGVFCVERLRFSKKINIYGVGRWGGGRGGRCWWVRNIHLNKEWALISNNSVNISIKCALERLDCLLLERQNRVVFGLH